MEEIVHSTRVTANTAAQAIVTAPLHQKVKLVDVEIDNQGSSGAITVKVQDVFTTSVGVVNTTATQYTKFRFQATVNQQASFSADKNSLQDTECWGAVSAICDKVDPSCVIIVRWKLA